MECEGDHLGEQTVDPNESLYNPHGYDFGRLIGDGPYFHLGAQDCGRSRAGLWAGVAPQTIQVCIGSYQTRDYKSHSSSRHPPADRRSGLFRGAGSGLAAPRLGFEL